MKKIRFWFAGCLLAVPLVLAVWGFLLPAQYRKTFPGELVVKCELLAQEAEKPRLVLVGGQRCRLRGGQRPAGRAAAAV